MVDACFDTENGTMDCFDAANIDIYARTYTHPKYVVYTYYTYIHIYIFTYIHIYIFTYLHIYIYIYIYIYIKGRKIQEGRKKHEGR
jgi:hypothetical protein